MRKIFFFIVIYGLQVLMIYGQKNPGEFPILKGPYLGQKPPGAVPVVFAPGIISTDAFELAITFAPDGKECFFTRRPTFEGSDNRLYYLQELNGIWTKPALAAFAEDFMEFETHINPTGTMVYFSSDRPKPTDINLKGDIWYAEKINGQWTEAKYLNSKMNDGFAMYVTSTRNHTLYFTGFYNRIMGIYRAPLIDGRYPDYEYLPLEINSIYPAHPFIAPDESYLVFDAQTAGPGKSALYLSFKKTDGSWTTALKLDATINASQTEMAASVSPDGKYFFFYRKGEGNGDIYWVSAQFIEALKPMELK